MRFKDQAICIRLTDWSESSQVVTLLTQTHGKIRGLAKGSRRLSPSAIAKFSGGFELLTAGQIVATTKPSSDLATLTEWDLQQPHVHLRRDLQAQYLGLYAADLANALLADHDAHQRSHDALLTLLGALEPAATRQAALLAYQWEIISDAGYALELLRDVKSKKTEQKNDEKSDTASDKSSDATSGELLPDISSYLFDPHTGGFTAHGGHERSDHPQGPWKVRASTVKMLRAIAGISADGEPINTTSEPDAQDDAQDDAQAIVRANKLLCVYVRAILDRELPTMKLLLEA